MPLVVGHALLGAGVVAAFADRDPKVDDDSRRLLVIGAALGALPDLDLVLTWVLGLGIKWHGGFTHSITAAVVIGFLATRYTGCVTLQRTLVLSGAVFSHGLLDAISKKTYGGTQLLWPFSDRRFKLGLFDYFAFYPDSKLDPIWKLALRAVEISLYELIIFGSGLLLIVALRRRLIQHRSAPKVPPACKPQDAADGKETDIGVKVE